MCMLGGGGGTNIKRHFHRSYQMWSAGLPNKASGEFWDNRLFRGTLGHAVLPVMGAPITICVVKLNLGSRKNTKDS